MTGCAFDLKPLSLSLFLLLRKKEEKTLFSSPQTKEGTKIINAMRRLLVCTKEPRKSAKSCWDCWKKKWFGEKQQKKGVEEYENGGWFPLSLSRSLFLVLSCLFLRSVVHMRQKKAKKEQKTAICEYPLSSRVFCSFFVCVLSGLDNHSEQQKENILRNAKKTGKSSGSTCDAQTETCKKRKKRKQKKQSLAELPAELKHITQRCKKKVTTIAKVTASELAIFNIYVYMVYIIYIYNIYIYDDTKSYIYIYIYVYVYIYMYIFLSRRPGKRKMCGSKTENSQKTEKQN